MGDLKDTMLIITMVTTAIGEILIKVVKYLDWDGGVEALFYAYRISEEGKGQLKYICEHRLRNRSRPIISWELLKCDLRDNFGILDYQEVETPAGEFCDPLCKKSDYVHMEEKYEGGSNGRRCHEMLKREQIKKASRVEESSRGIQAKIEIEGSVEVHVEEEMSKEDFCDSMSDMSFEEGRALRLK
ncbi:hypothetical protein M9H77_12585 [Catharanthus roseus]|uniref:Uncharacterized protein n=1 Tax=Catharanthus roseus TaxID=4058 RepID=A0ACC0BHY3_CATRO|nr:hypothetical protein M9H77_12585 [Catharanthus roseus]